MNGECPAYFYEVQDPRIVEDAFALFLKNEFDSTGSVLPAAFAAIHSAGPDFIDEELDVFSRAREEDLGSFLESL